MTLRRLKPLLFLLCLAPAAALVWGFFRDALGANPVEKITHTTGEWALRLLLASLAVTPLRKLFGWPGLITYRRMLGLFSFFYLVLHFLTWFALDKSLDSAEMLADVVKRPFITAGMVGLLCTVPLALTSTAGAIRRLGGRRWQLLHRLAYVAAAAGIVHYYWLVKSDVRGPVTYGVVFAVLMLARVLPQRRRAPVEATGGR